MLLPLGQNSSRMKQIPKTQTRHMKPVSNTKHLAPLSHPSENRCSILFPSSSPPLQLCLWFSSGRRSPGITSCSPAAPSTAAAAPRPPHPVRPQHCCRQAHRLHRHHHHPLTPSSRWVWGGPSRPTRCWPLLHCGRRLLPALLPAAPRSPHCCRRHPPGAPLLSGRQQSRGRRSKRSTPHPGPGPPGQQLSI